ncbi:MAG: prepilin-type N-terminal cleavage/methylation domain-containing protein [Firmicutes bacterium]|nr:prepilin-type N-terminal cleavage/methylation domain-containing protein [Bacillota bacterium]
MKWRRMVRKYLLTLAGESGLTLIELLVVLALLGVVLGSIYQYFFFSHHQRNRAAAESRSIQDARLTLARLDREIRQARKATESAGAVAVPDDNQLDIYTDVISGDDGKPELVRYKLELNGALVRGVSRPQGSEYPYTYEAPGTWETVVSTVANDTDPLFILDDRHSPRLVVNVDLLVDDSATPLARPVQIQAAITVRSREDAK